MRSPWGESSLDLTEKQRRRSGWIDCEDERVVHSRALTPSAGRRSRGRHAAALAPLSRRWSPLKSSTFFGLGLSAPRGDRSPREGAARLAGEGAPAPGNHTLRVYYTSEGGELLACERNGLTPAAARAAAWAVGPHVSEAKAYYFPTCSKPPLLSGARLVTLPSQAPAPERVELPEEPAPVAAPECDVEEPADDRLTCGRCGAEYDAGDGAAARAFRGSSAPASWRCARSSRRGSCRSPTAQNVNHGLSKIARGAEVARLSVREGVLVGVEFGAAVKAEP